MTPGSLLLSAAAAAAAVTTTTTNRRCASNSIKKRRRWLRTARTDEEGCGDSERARGGWRRASAAGALPRGAELHGAGDAVAFGQLSATRRDAT